MKNSYILEEGIKKKKKRERKCPKLTFLLPVQEGKQKTNSITNSIIPPCYPSSSSKMAETDLQGAEFCKPKVTQKPTCSLWNAPVTSQASSCAKALLNECWLRNCIQPLFSLVPLVFSSTSSK